MFEKPDDANGRRWIDGVAVRLVIEADVTAGNRYVQRATCCANPFDCFGELPHDLGPLRISEVEAVGRAERLRTSAGDVARRLRNREHRAAKRIEVAVSAVSIDRHGERAIGPLD